MGATAKRSAAVLDGTQILGWLDPLAGAQDSDRRVPRVRSRRPSNRNSALCPSRRLQPARRHGRQIGTDRYWHIGLGNRRSADLRIQNQRDRCEHGAVQYARSLHGGARRRLAW